MSSVLSFDIGQFTSAPFSRSSRKIADDGLLVFCEKVRNIMLTL